MHEDYYDGTYLYIKYKITLLALIQTVTLATRDELGTCSFKILLIWILVIGLQSYNG